MLASDELQAGQAFTLLVGGKLTDGNYFNGLALGQPVYDGGEQLQAEITSRVSHVGEALRSMGFGGNRPEPPEGFGGERPDFPEGFGPPMFKQ